MVAKMAAEHLAAIVPKGTHHWDMLVFPDELETILTEGGFNTINSKELLNNSIIYYQENGILSKIYQ